MTVGLTLGVAAPALSQGGAAASAAIRVFQFQPGALAVRPGTRVTWTNEDGVPHRVKANDDSFESEDLAQGDTFEHTFDAAGTFDYICAIHPDMTGTITVTG